VKGSDDGRREWKDVPERIQIQFKSIRRKIRSLFS
jgi:hypothetical protein